MSPSGGRDFELSMPSVLRPHDNFHARASHPEASDGTALIGTLLRRTVSLHGLRQRPGHRHGAAAVVLVMLAAVVLVVVEEQYSEHSEQSGGLGSEQAPWRASNTFT
jgi:hypothetical protein